jgi:hypothetical protein
MFLQQAFGINPDGTSIMDQALLPERVKKYKSIKTINQYNHMDRCLTHNGDDKYLAAALDDDLKASRVYRFCKQHPQGYNYVKFFSIEKSDLWTDPPIRF